jgi:RND family efflux transporter MFP subunit
MAHLCANGYQGYQGYQAIFCWGVCSLTLSLGALGAAQGQAAAGAKPDAATTQQQRPAAVASAVREGGGAGGAAAPLGCLIEASATVEVGSPVIGVLESLPVDRGGSIRKGQVLAQFESSVERANLSVADLKARHQADMLSARAQKQYAVKKAKRAVELTELRFVSAQAREQADAEASVADMRLAQALEQRAQASQELLMARAQLAQRTVISPITGVVVDRYASVGERIENRPIMKVAQIDPLRVEVVLPASRFNTIKPGSRLRVVPELIGASAQTATVAMVDRVIDAASNTFRLRLNLPNPQLALPAGVRCKVDFSN